MRRTLTGPYQVITGVSEDSIGNVSISTASLETLSNASYVQAAIRITGMNNKNRSGDVVLLMNDATAGNASERYTTGVACKSWHGSLNPSDSYVPFIVAYPGGNKSEIETIVGRDVVCPQGRCEGNWKAKELINEIIKTQYTGQ